MKISPDNPHLVELEKSIVDSFLWPYPNKWLFSPLIGEEEFDLLYNSFPFLTKEEKEEVIAKIIRAYCACETYKKSTACSWYTTRVLTTLLQQHVPQS